MWTSTLALNGLTAAGLGRVGFPMHMIEHSLSALYDIAHGAGLAIVIPAWLTWFGHANPDRVAQLGRRVFPGKLQQAGSTADTAMSTIDCFRTWFASVGCPVSLARAGIKEDEIPAIAANALRLAKVWRLKEYNQNIIEKILQLCC
jgi:alcohol dehydrogenase YqhD (iron-dependent ADH family)